MLSLMSFLIALAGFFLSIFLFLRSEIFDNDQRRIKFLRTVDANEHLKLYHQWIEFILSKIDMFFGAPWSFRTYSKLLLLAIIYPALFLFIGYVVSGHHQLGTISIYPIQKHWVVRIGYCLFHILFGYVFYWICRKFSTIVSLIKKIYSLNEGIGMIVLPTIVFMAVFAPIGIVAEVFGAMILFNLFIIVGIILIYGEHINPENPLAGRNIFIALCVLFLGTFSFSAVTDGVNERAFTVIFFLLMLPVANSLFDFISFEISRLLIRKSYKSDNKIGIVKWIFLDFLIALMLLFGTALCLISIVEIYNWIGASYIEGFFHIDWRQTGSLALDDPFSKGLSINLILFSTLIWTLIHVIITFISLILIPFGRSYIINLCRDEKNEYRRNSIGAIWLTGNLFVSFFIFCILPCLFYFFVGGF